MPTGSAHGRKGIASSRPQAEPRSASSGEVVCDRSPISQKSMPRSFVFRGDGQHQATTAPQPAATMTPVSSSRVCPGAVAVGEAEHDQHGAERAGRRPSLLMPAAPKPTRIANIAPTLAPPWRCPARRGRPAGSGVASCISAPASASRPPQADRRAPRQAGRARSPRGAVCPSSAATTSKARAGDRLPAMPLRNS